jgi:hypothetical protein
MAFLSSVSFVDALELSTWTAETAAL